MIVFFYLLHNSNKNSCNCHFQLRALGPNHIRVAQVSPGVVETEFSFAMNPGKPEKAEKLYSSMLCIQVGLHICSCFRNRGPFK